MSTMTPTEALTVLANLASEGLVALGDEAKRKDLAAGRYDSTTREQIMAEIQADHDAALAVLDALSESVPKPETAEERAARKALIANASARYDTENITVDDDAALSESEDGCWVAAWVWVPEDD